MNKESRIKTQDYVCPWWLIKTFDNPLRKVIQKPEKILDGLVKPGFHCIDFGCGFGYYTIAMAKMVGSNGSVTAVDIQPQMLDGTRRRAEKYGLIEQVKLQLANASALDSTGKFDFALAFWMMHEVKDQQGFSQTIFRLLKQEGRLLIVEPKIHVSKASFFHSIQLIENVGFKFIESRKVFFSRAFVLKKV